MNDDVTPWQRCPVFEAEEAWTPARVERGRRLLRAVLREFPPGASGVAELARQLTRRRFDDEMRAVSARTGCTLREVMLTNISYDLAMHTLGCSTAAIATPQGPVLARNLDWWPERELAQASESVWDHEGRFCATWPGFSGVVTGMSPRGFAVAINAVSSIERAALTGYPVLLYLRLVLDEARGFDDAVERLTTTTIAAPALFTVVGQTNAQRAVIERTPRRAVVRRPDNDAALVATNDYRTDVDQGGHRADFHLYNTACARFDALTRRLQALSPDDTLDDAKLLGALSDPDVLQDITVQHAVMRPAQQSAHTWAPRRWLQAGEDAPDGAAPPSWMAPLLGGMLGGVQEG